MTEKIYRERMNSEHGSLNTEQPRKIETRITEEFHERRSCKKC